MDVVTFLLLCIDYSFPCDAAAVCAWRLSSLCSLGNASSMLPALSSVDKQICTPLGVCDGICKQACRSHQVSCESWFGPLIKLLRDAVFLLAPRETKIELVDSNQEYCASMRLSRMGSQDTGAILKRALGDHEPHNERQSPCNCLGLSGKIDHK